VEPEASERQREKVVGVLQAKTPGLQGRGSGLGEAAGGLVLKEVVRVVGRVVGRVDSGVIDVGPFDCVVEGSGELLFVAEDSDGVAVIGEDDGK
jgi:hypothetical protein